MAGSSTETFPTSSDGTYGVGNVKFTEHTDVKEEEVNVKTVSDEVECIHIKDEDCICSEEERHLEEEEVYVEKEEEEEIEVKEEGS
jgi:hypothetical protein